MEQETKRYRYPGLFSFEAGDRDIFFGREGDLRHLSELVDGEKTVLLYSRSGLGKSSLIKAALLPDLAAKGYNAFYIHLKAYQAGNLPPAQNVLKLTVLEQNGQVPATFLNKFLNRNNSLWYAFKSAQAAGDDRPVVLVFDQFEEIGSYPDEQLVEFKKQLAELLYSPIPTKYTEALDLDLLSEPLTEAETDLLYRPLRVKAVFAIRSDRMSVLNTLSDRLPNILKSYLELGALDPLQATEAICAPAAKGTDEGGFATPSFRFDDGAVQKILGSLGYIKGGIDTAHLQILLYHVERKLVEEYGFTDITAYDLGDLDAVYENHYFDSLARIPEGKQRENARRLLEDRLIVDDRRIALDIALCLQTVGQDVLDLLVDARLLRKEPNNLGSFSYEISHDTLVAPIYEAKKQREEAEKALEREREEEEERREEERRQAEALREAQENAKMEREKRKALEKKRWEERRSFSLVSMAAIVFMALAAWAWWQKREADQLNTELQKTKNRNKFDVYMGMAKEQEARRNYEVALAALDSARVFTDDTSVISIKMQHITVLSQKKEDFDQYLQKADSLVGEAFLSTGPKGDRQVNYYKNAYAMLFKAKQMDYDQDAVSKAANIVGRFLASDIKYTKMLLENASNSLYLEEAKTGFRIKIKQLEAVAKSLKQLSQ